MSPSVPRGTCKPGANSQWFNSFKIAISLAFLGETTFHQKNTKLWAQRKAESYSFYVKVEGKNSYF